MRIVGIPWRAMCEVRQNLILRNCSGSDRKTSKNFSGTAPIDSLTIQLLGPKLQCTLVGHGGRNDTTGSKGRDDCCGARSDRSIAASTRTVRRARLSAGRISEAGPNSVAPACFLLHQFDYSCAAMRAPSRAAFQSAAPTNLKPSPQRRTRPVEGAGKCVAHITVGSSQKRSNTLRRVFPACGES